MNIDVRVDTIMKLSPAARWRDSMNRHDKTIELHIREDFAGIYKYEMNDSVYINGQIYGDPRSGYAPIYKLLVNKATNILIITDTKGNTQRLTIDTRYTNVTLWTHHDCILHVIYSNDMPFRG